LAKRTSLSVRTLHHYDEIGLLSPTERTRSGHRLYGPDEIARLQQILSLRQLGLSLDEIASYLERPVSTPERVVALHLGRVRQQIESLTRLVGRLERLAAHFEAAETVSVDEFIQAIEEIRMTEKYFTPEQLERLEARREIVGEDRIQQVQERWADIAARAKGAMDAGEDPASAGVRALAREWRELTTETVQGFAGGDAEIEASVARMWREEPDMGSQWGLGPEVREYIGRAMATLGDADEIPE
jgi:DNA-binding transcriptional MerR regulator